MKRVTLVESVLCDFPHPQPVDAGQVFTVALDAGARGSSHRRRVDACAEHVGLLMELLDVVRRCDRLVGAERAKSTAAESAVTGAPSAKLLKASMPTGCPSCGTVLRTDALYGHLKVRHGATSPVQPRTCPDCDFRSPVSRSMLRHRNFRHDYTVLAEMLEQVRAGQVKESKVRRRGK